MTEVQKIMSRSAMQVTALNSHEPERQRRCLEEYGMVSCAYLLSNSNLCDDVMRDVISLRLADGNIIRLDCSRISRKNLPEDVIRLLYSTTTKKVSGKEFLLRQKEMPIEILERAAKRKFSYHLFAQLVQNPNVPSKSLIHMAKVVSNHKFKFHRLGHSLKYAVINHPNFPEDKRFQYLLEM